MMRFLHISLILVLASIVIFSCKHSPLEIEEEITSNPTFTDSLQISCDEDSVYFQNQIFPILQSNCAFSGCHGEGSSQDGVSLESYSSIISTADVEAFDPDGSDLYEVITDNDPDDRMPPPPNNPLSPEQVALIELWINQGALNNSCQSCDTVDVGFNSHIAPLVQSFCQGCHSGSSPDGGISLTNYSQIQTIAANGSLLSVVNHEAGFEPMPYNSNQLSECEIQKLTIWVENGALND